MPLHPVVLSALLEWRKQSPFAGELDFLFPSARHKGKRPLSPDSILAKSIRPALAKEGIVGKRIGWHSFRHSLATNLRSLGVDIKVAQELLRHSSCRTTPDASIHAVDQQKRAANSRVVELMLPLETKNFSTLPHPRRKRGRGRRCPQTVLNKGFFGGPGRDRTDDLFHAMEARSQLRHRPTLVGRNLATYSFSLSAGVKSNSLQCRVFPISDGFSSERPRTRATSQGLRPATRPLHIRRRHLLRTHAAAAGERNVRSSGTWTPSRKVTVRGPMAGMRSPGTMMPTRFKGSAAEMVMSSPETGRLRTSRTLSTASGRANCSPIKPETKRPPRTSPRSSRRRNANCNSRHLGQIRFARELIHGKRCHNGGGTSSRWLRCVLRKERIEVRFHSHSPSWRLMRISARGFGDVFIEIPEQRPAARGVARAFAARRNRSSDELSR